MELKIGDQAPDFSLPDQDNKKHSLSEYRGRYLLLYFYPADFTPGCTVEACTFRDIFPSFDTNKYTVVGISHDPVEKHKKFSDKYGLPFTLLSDEDAVVNRLYGVWHGRTVRTSFLIDPQGNIAKIYEKVKPAHHPQEVLEDLKSLT